MAYIIGLVNKEEIEELERRGWTLEYAPENLDSEDYDTEKYSMKMIFVDANMIDIMSGPDWQQ
jgi:hypothetical protein